MAPSFGGLLAVSSGDIIMPTGDSAAGTPGDRIQLCGSLPALVDGRRVDEELKRPEERVAFAYLVVRRLSPVEPSELIGALWPERPPSDAEQRVGQVLRRLRRVLGQ